MDIESFKRFREDKKQENNDLFINQINKTIEKIQEEPNWKRFSEEHKIFEIEVREMQIELIKELRKINKEFYSDEKAESERDELDTNSFIQFIYDISPNYKDGVKARDYWIKKIKRGALEYDLSDTVVERLISALV